MRRKPLTTISTPHQNTTPPTPNNAQEKPDAILPTMGGQTGLNLAKALAESGVLDRHGVELIGAKLPSIDRAEDRELFKQAMIRIGLGVPKSGTASNMDEALAIAADIGKFPLIIRPAFTLGGTGGGISYNMEEFKAQVQAGIDASMTNQVLIEQSLLGWKEFELEVMRDLNDNCMIVCRCEREREREREERERGGQRESSGCPASCFALSCLFRLGALRASLPLLLRFFLAFGGRGLGRRGPALLPPASFSWPRSRALCAVARTVGAAHNARPQTTAKQHTTHTITHQKHTHTHHNTNHTPKHTQTHHNTNQTPQTPIKT